MGASGNGEVDNVSGMAGGVGALGVYLKLSSSSEESCPGVVGVVSGKE